MPAVDFAKASVSSWVLCCRSTDDTVTCLDSTLHVEYLVELLPGRHACKASRSANSARTNWLVILQAGLPPAGLPQRRPRR